MSTVRRPAIGFKFGKYPKKNFECSREEFVVANGRTGTIPVGLDPTTGNHYSGRRNDLDGRTGTATFAVDDAGDLLPLTLNLPAWVNDLADAKGYKLSAVFDNPRDKRLLQVDLVDQGHVREAVLLADELIGPAEVSFAEDDEDEPDDPYQVHHEMLAARHPELCDPRHKPGGDKHDALIALHDDCVFHGAACPGMHALPDDDPEPPKKGKVQMSDENEVDHTAHEDAVAFSEGRLDDIQNPTFKAIAQQAKQDRDRAIRLQAQILDKDAVTFADSLIGGKDARATPAERAALVRQFKAAARLDELDGHANTVEFSDGAQARKGSHVDAFRAECKLRAALNLKGEKVANGEVELSEEPGNRDPAEQAKRDARKARNQKAANPHVAAKG